MIANVSNVIIEPNRLVSEIIRLSSRGMTDREIGNCLSRHPKTIIYHRRRHSINSGRSHKAALSKQRRVLTMNTRSYKMDCVIPITRTKIRHGLNAYAPITCKGDDCPYRATCHMPGDNLVVGEPCVTETAIITTLWEEYCYKFQVEDDNVADMARVRHLIELEIKLIRCNRLMAQKPELVFTSWEGEEPLRILNPAARYELLLMGEYGRILKDLRTVAVV